MAGPCKRIAKRIPATIAWTILVTTTGTFFIFPFPDLYAKYGYPLVMVQIVITVFVVTNFFLATFMDPGAIPKASPEEDTDDDFRAPLYKTVEINGRQLRMKWCVTCQFYRPPRCSHCSNCDMCVDTFDHHCPWVNNCIGRRNYRHFFCFLISLSTDMITTFVWCILYVLDNKENLHATDSIVTLVLICIISILFIPIIGLTLFHVYLVSVGRTTNEQVTGKFTDDYNPFSGGCCHNFCRILCGPRYPRRRVRHRSKELGSAYYVGNSEGSQTPGVRIYMDEPNSKATIDPNSAPMYSHKQSKITTQSHRQSMAPKSLASASPHKRTSATITTAISAAFAQSPTSTSSSSQNGIRKPVDEANQSDSISQSSQPPIPDSFAVTVIQKQNGKTETTFGPLPNDAITGSVRHPLILQHTKKQGEITDVGSMVKQGIASTSPLNSPGRNNGPSGGIVIYYSPTSDPETQEKSHLSEKQYEISV